MDNHHQVDSAKSELGYTSLCCNATRRNVVLVAMGLFVASVLGSGASSQRLENLRASSLTVIDKGGAERIRLRMSEDGTPTLSFYDEDKTERLSLGLKKGGSPEVTLWDDKNTPRLALRLDEKNSPELAILDAEARNIVVAGVAKGRPGIVVFGEKGEAVGMRIDPGHSPLVQLSDQEGWSRLTLKLEPTGKPVVNFAGKDGQIEYQVPTVPK